MNNRLQAILFIVLLISLFFNYTLLQKNQDDVEINILKEEARLMVEGIKKAEKQRDSLLSVEPKTVEVIKDSVIYLPEYKELDRDGVITVVKENFDIIIEDTTTVTLLLQEVYNNLRAKDSCCKTSETFEKEYIFVTNLLTETRQNTKTVTQLKDSLIINKQEQIDYLVEKDKFKMLAGMGLVYGNNLGFNLKLGCQIKQKHLLFMDVGSLDNTPYIGINYAITYR